MVLFKLYYGDPAITITVSLVLRDAEVCQIMVYLGTWVIGRYRTTIDSEIRNIEGGYNSEG